MNIHFGGEIKNKSPFAVKHFAVVNSCLEDLSLKINDGDESYQDHLNSLKEFLTGGKTDKRYIEEINKVLVNEITKSSSEKSRIEITVGQAKMELEELISKLRLLISNGINKRADAFQGDLETFKEKFKQTLQ